MTDHMKPIFDALNAAAATSPAPDPAPPDQPCCKCAAYREIMKENAAEIAALKKALDECHQWAAYIVKYAKDTK